MCCLTPYFPRNSRKKKCIKHSDEVINAECRTHFISGFIIFNRLRIFTGKPINMCSYRVCCKYPHGKQCEPGKKLNESQLFHCFRHMPEIVDDFTNTRSFM